MTTRVITSKNQEFSNSRKYARKTYLNRLVREQTGLCYHCKKEIVSLYEIRSRIVDIDYDKQEVLLFNEVGDNELFALATVDHLVKLENGGNSHWRNLVASCFACNNERSKSKDDLPLKPAVRRQLRQFGTRLGPLLKQAGFST